MRLTQTALFASACAVVMTGCSSSGPLFDGFVKPTAKEAMVYFYRPEGLMRSMMKYDVYDGTALVTTLRAGGYYAYKTKPGNKVFMLDGKPESALKLDLKRGKTYFIRGSYGNSDFMEGFALKLIPNEQGEFEVLDLKLLQEPKAE